VGTKLYQFKLNFYKLLPD